MRLWVAGGRWFDDMEWMKRDTAEYVAEGWDLVTGANRNWDKERGRWVGADYQAESVWRVAELPYQGVPARWKLEGRGAGPSRNLRIAADYRPDRLLIFPGGQGTGHAKMVARKYEIPTVEAEP